MKGGYQILNLKNINLAVGTPTVITEAYETLEGNYKKAVLVTGFKANGTEVGDFFTLPYVAQANYVIKVAVGENNYTITIAADDKVTLTQG